MSDNFFYYFNSSKHFCHPGELLTLHLFMQSLTVEMQNTLQNFFVNFTCVLSKGKVNQSKSKLIAVSAAFDKGPDFVCIFSSGSFRHCKVSAGHQVFSLKLMP